jgi:hypothetical protein
MTKRSPTVPWPSDAAERIKAARDRGVSFEAIAEIVHAIFAVGTVQIKQGEEHVVSVIATYLAQIIRDNPEFVTWLQATVKR